MKAGIDEDKFLQQWKQKKEEKNEKSFSFPLRPNPRSFSSVVYNNKIIITFYLLRDK